MVDFSRICTCGREDVGLHTIGICQALKEVLGPDEEDDEEEDAAYA